MVPQHSVSICHLKLQRVNILTPRQNGHFFKGDIFKYIFYHKYALNSNEIPFQCVSEGWTYWQEITIPSSNTLASNSQQAISRTNAIKVSDAIWYHWS